MTNPSTQPSGRLCQTFSNESAKIWKNLTAARSWGFPYGEETITDNLLLGVQQAHETDVITIPFGKHDEKFSGADWEWWLTDGKSWFGLLIQAKRLGRDPNKYGNIKHLVGQHQTPQIKILLDMSRHKGIDALYFFYNYNTSSLASVRWNCRTFGKDVTQLGCTVAHAAAVNRVVMQGGAGLPKMSAISNPLRCLICCPAFASLGNSLPERAHGVTQRLRTLVSDGLDEAGADEPAPRDNPPPYVRKLFDAPVRDRGRVIDEIRKEIGPVGALAIIKAVPE